MVLYWKFQPLTNIIRYGLQSTINLFTDTKEGAGRRYWVSGTPSHAAWSGHQGDTALHGTQEHPAYGAIYRADTSSIQGLLEGLAPLTTHKHMEPQIFDGKTDNCWRSPTEALIMTLIWCKSNKVKKENNDASI